jgi:hypothetical protein
MEIEQGRINVPIGGISRAGSESKTNDGLCNEIINLEAKDMTLVPYEHKSVETNGCKIYGYKTKKIFLHKTSIQTNLVYINSANELRFFNYEKFNKQKKESFSEDDKGCILAEQDGLYYIESTKIGNVDEYENVDLFYNMFSFRDGTWYMFKEEKYSITNTDKALRISLAFDVKTKGIAIAERKFPNTSLMQYDGYVGLGLRYESDKKKKVAKSQAKSANGLFNVIDSKIKEENHIDGVCYLRYGVKTANGYSYISSPILISSPYATKMFSLYDCVYRNTEIEEEDKEQQEIISIPPMIMLGGAGTYNMDKNESNTKQIFVSPAIGEQLSVSKLRRFIYPYTNDGDWKYGYEIGEYNMRCYEGFSDNIGIQVNEKLKEKQLAGMICHYLKTFGYDAENKYLEEVDETEAISANTNCKLIDKLKKLESYDKFFEDSTEEKDYVDSSWKCPLNEYSWMISSIAVDNNIKPAFMYACKEYGNLNVMINKKNTEFIEAISSDVITSVDVFISRPITPVLPHIKDTQEVREEAIAPTFNGETAAEYWQGAQCAGGRIWKEEKEFKKELEASVNTYYKLLSLDKKFFNEEDEKEWIDINDKIISLENIESSEMQDLILSGDENIGSYKVSYIYNGQQHVALGNLDFNNKKTMPDNHKRESGGNAFYILYDFEQNDKRYYYKEYFNYTYKYATPISFPSASLKRVRIVSTDRKLIKEYKEEHIQKGTDFSYVYSNHENTEYDTESKYIVFPYIKTNATGGIVDDFDNYKETLSIESLSNEMYVSKYADPMTLDEIYQIGLGDIIAISSNTVALSQGQYGEFPLIVFTTEGIYSCGLASDKLKYQQILPISREICNNPKSICQVDNGVFFSSEKGLMVISGTQVLAVSDVVKGTPKPTGNIVYENAIGNVKLVELKGNVSKIDFVEYLKECQIVYLYNKNKLLITNENYDYSYLYDLGEKTFTKLSYKYHYSISNYPNDLLVANQGDNSYIYEFPIESVDETIETMIETRAIKLATEDIKSSYRVILKGLFETDGDEDNHLGIYVFGSLDCEKWAYIGGNEVSCKHKTIRNIGCKVERMGAKYLRVLFIGKLKKGSKVDTLEISSTKKYSNKIR